MATAIGGAKYRLSASCFMAFGGFPSPFVASGIYPSPPAKRL